MLPVGQSERGVWRSEQDKLRWTWLLTPSGSRSVGAWPRSSLGPPPAAPRTPPRASVRRGRVWEEEPELNVSNDLDQLAAAALKAALLRGMSSLPCPMAPRSPESEVLLWEFKFTPVLQEPGLPPTCPLHLAPPGPLWLFVQIRKSLISSKHQGPMSCCCSATDT